MKLKLMIPVFAMVAAGIAVAVLTSPNFTAQARDIGYADSFIAKKYPGARIMDRDYGHNVIEVEIRHNGVDKDVYFDAKHRWIRSEWDVPVRRLPAAVRTAVSRQYPGYRIDDALLIESPQGQYYELELDRRWTDEELHICITQLGRVM